MIYRIFNSIPNNFFLKNVRVAPGFYSYLLVQVQYHPLNLLDVPVEKIFIMEILRREEIWRITL